LFCPLELCRNGVEIIDSPGLSESKVREDIMLDYLGAVDAVLFMLSAISPGLWSSEELSVKHIRSAGHEDILFVYNRINQIHPDELEMVKQYHVSRIEAITERTGNHIFFVNALGALRGRLEDDPALLKESSVPQLEAALETFLIEQKGREKILRPADKLRSSIREFRWRIIPELEAMLKDGLDAVKERYREAQEPLRHLQVQRNQIVQRAALMRRKVERDVAGMAESFYASLADTVEDWVTEYEVKNPLQAGELRKKKERESALERVCSEIAEYGRNMAELETIRWQQIELQPFLKRSAEELRRNIDARISEFTHNLDTLRVGVTRGVPMTRGVPLSQLLSEEATERYVSSANLALRLIPGSLIEDATERERISVLMMESIKKELSEQYAKELSTNAERNARRFAEEMGENFMNLEAALNQGMEEQIRHLREQIESVLTEQQKGETEIQERLEELDSARGRLDEIDEELDDLVSQVGRA
jgi:hypothetical protein